MKIKISQHIKKDKIPLLRKQGFKITLKQIKEIIKNPEHIDEISDTPKVIVSKEFDKSHIMRVVYKIEDDIIKAITVYPSEKGRYY